MLLPSFCVFFVLTYLHVLSPTRTLSPSLAVLQHSPSPLSLCLQLHSSFPASQSFCLAWWMESLDCELHILSGVWQAIANCLTSEWIWVFFLLFFFQLVCLLRWHTWVQILFPIHQNGSEGGKKLGQTRTILMTGLYFHVAATPSLLMPSWTFRISASG